MNMIKLIPCALALLIPVCGFAVDPKCKKKGDVGERAACVVTNAFYAAHLATSEANAQNKTIALGARSTFLQVTDTNLLRLNEAADRAGRTSKTVTAWSCTLNETKKTPSATCTGPRTLTVNFCSKLFNSPASEVKVYHLDTNTSGACK
jgi:hypothetical protein